MHSPGNDRLRIRNRFRRDECKYLVPEGLAGEITLPSAEAKRGRGDQHEVDIADRRVLLDEGDVVVDD